MVTIESITNDLVTRWNNQMRYVRAYQLDQSWPSIALLDAILRPLIQQLPLSFGQITTINACAGYLGFFLRDTWKEFPEMPLITLHLTDPTKLSTQLTAHHSKSKSLLFSLNLSEAILAAAQDTTLNFYFFPMTQRVLPPEYPRIQLMASSLLIGIHQNATGIWSAPNAALDDDKQIVVSHAIAKSTAEHYRQRFPEEQIGEDVSLYDGVMLFPPAMHFEPFPFTRATLAAAHRLKQRQCSDEQYLNFAKNALRTSDDVLSHTGLALLLAVGEESDPQLLLNVQSRQHYILTLVPARNIVLQSREVDHSWFSVAISAFDKNDKQLLLKAQTLLASDFNRGLIPHLRLPGDMLDSLNSLMVFNALFIGNLERALQLIEGIESESPLSEELKIQRAYLQLRLHRPAQAKITLQTVRATDLPIYREAYAMMLQQLEGMDVALGFMQTLLDDCPSGYILQNIGGEILRHGYKTNNLDLLQETAETMLAKGPELNALLAKIHVLLQRAELEEAQKLLALLRKYIPYDHRVIGLTLQTLSIAQSNDQDRSL